VSGQLTVLIRRVAWGVAWGVAALLASGVIMRLAWHDGLWLYLLLNGWTPFAYLPAWPVAAAAVVARRWRLAGVALAVVLFHGYWTLAPLLPRAAHAAPGAGQRLRVASANLLEVNQEPEALAAELERLDADVYFLQELSAEWDELLEARGFWRRYPFNRRLITGDAFGNAIASRVPARDLAVFGSAELPQMRGVLQFEGRDVELVSIHLMPPRTLDYARRYHRPGTDAVLEIARQLGGRSFIIAGDFNATPDSYFAARMRRFADDAWEAAGSGFGFTWPNGMFPFPPMRLDHVFVSRDLEVVAVSVGRGPGSDHRPVTVDLVLRR
jgi:endonuclease/exonuclease/phosphatase (EEP) superfamily protein YafD